MQGLREKPKGIGAVRFAAVVVAAAGAELLYWRSQGVSHGATGGEVSRNPGPVINMTPTVPTLTMSSREIAELTGKRHDHVVADIRNMLGELGRGVLSFQHTSTNPQNGQTYAYFNLPHQETLILLTVVGVNYLGRPATTILAGGGGGMF